MKIMSSSGWATRNSVSECASGGAIGTVLSPHAHAQAHAEATNQDRDIVGP
jgi:hypothetical protein